MVPLSGSPALSVQWGRSKAYRVATRTRLEVRPRSLALLPLELLGAPEGSCLVHACLDGEQLTVHLAITAPTAACPVCGSDARRVRSRYTRRLEDLPCLGRRVRLRVAVRRFVCPQSDCPRRLFAERLPGFAAPRARTTDRLRQTQTDIGASLGGEAGSRLATRMALPTSPDTLLRRVKQLQDKPARPLRVVEDLYLQAIRREQEPRIAAAKQKLKEEREEFFSRRDWFSEEDQRPMRQAEAAVTETLHEGGKQYRALGDPTGLILIDEADRVKTAGLEQVRDIFDRGGLGVVLIGMPGLERRLARYAQLYSRIGFVHEFRTLGTPEVRNLLADWRPPGATLPADLTADPEAVAAIIRITGGNFRLLERLLTQVARILALNGLATVTREAVEAAREVLVIGTA